MPKLRDFTTTDNNAVDVVTTIDLPTYQEGDLLVLTCTYDSSRTIIQVGDTSWTETAPTPSSTHNCQTVAAKGAALYSNTQRLLKSHQNEVQTNCYLPLPYQWQDRGQTN